MMKKHFSNPPNTRIGDLSKMVGNRFRADTDLNPSGFILNQEGIRVEAMTEDYDIDKDSIVLVTRTVGMTGVFVEQVVDTSSITEMI